MFTSALKNIEQWMFSRSEQQAFLEDVSNLIQDGVPANQAIETIHQVSKGHQRQVAEAIMSKIAEGKHLADGMAGWVLQATN